MALQTSEWPAGERARGWSWRPSAGVLLAGIVLLAIAVRAAGIGARLSNDEAYSWFVAASPNAQVFLARLAASENTPPLFYLVLMLVPGQPGWLRLPAAIPGVLMCAATYVVARRWLGGGAALLSALAVAASPYLVTYSDLARGFMLADLALLVALGALLSLGERETKAGWITLVAAGALAVYCEYASAIFLVAMFAAAVWIGRPRRRPTLIAGALTLVALAPWIPEIVRGQDQIGVTKFNPIDASPSFVGLRDAVVTLALGENGGTGSSAGRWLLLAAVLAAVVGGWIVLRRRWNQRPAGERRAIALLAASIVLTIAGYALAAVVGIDVFNQRYLTILIPLAAILGAVVLVAAGQRALLVAVAGVLVVLGLGNTVRRAGGEWQPDLAPVRSAAIADQPRTVLTNTPLVLYYLPRFHPTFDRPYNLGPGLAQSCLRPCLVVDDTRVPGGTPRALSGRTHAIGPFVLTLEP